MTLRQIICQASKIDSWRGEKVQDFSKLFQEVGLNEFDADVSQLFEDRRMTRVEITSWLCTDRIVGLTAYFFDGRFALLGNLPARKSDETFTWASTEMFESVRDYLKSFIHYPERRHDIISDASLDMEMEDHFHVPYACELIPAHRISHGGVPCEVVVKEPGGSYTQAIIEANGERKQVAVEDLDIEYFPGYEGVTP